MGGLWGQFLCYRFDSASLACDCVAAFLRGKGGGVGRILALIGAILIFGPSVFVLILGEDKFGNGWAFGLTLILFLVMLEKPGFMWRREIVLGEASPDTFDQFLFGVLTVISMTAPIVLLGVHIHSAVLLGVVWGVALVGAQDLARSGIAFFLALAGGLPIYRP